jgi:serine/threonine-protein kinase RsbW
MRKHKELIIESSLGEMYLVEQFVEEISDEYLLYGSYYGNMLMAVTEAVTNAIIHGNHEKRERKVIISKYACKEGLWIKVEDQGEGFEYSNPLLIEGPLNASDSGKNGLFLIHKLSDEVRFSKNGRSIEMLFRIYGIDENIFSRRVAFMHDFFRVYQEINA